MMEDTYLFIYLFLWKPFPETVLFPGITGFWKVLMGSWGCWFQELLTTKDKPGCISQAISNQKVLEVGDGTECEKLRRIGISSE